MYASDRQNMATLRADFVAVGDDLRADFVAVSDGS